MNCCNANGVCDQGKDCPVRKQRIKEVNDAYANGYNDGQLDDPMGEAFATFAQLITWLFVVGVAGVLAFSWWKS